MVLNSIKTAQLTEFRNFSTSFVSWKGQITNAFLLPFSTGYTEGCNNKIKVLKRISYGLRHFGHFRTRILLLSKKNGTEHKGIRCRKKLVDQLDPNICKRAYFYLIRNVRVILRLSERKSMQAEYQIP